MVRVGLVVLSLLVAAAPLMGEPNDAEKLRRERKKWREVTRRGVVPDRARALKLLERIAAIESPAAETFLVEVARDSRHEALREDLIMLLARAKPKSAIVAKFMKLHMAPNDPSRHVARQYLLDRAILRRDRKWLRGLFDGGTLSDKFRALDGLGRLNSEAALAAAEGLVSDPNWKPNPREGIGCAVIAASLRDFEGPRAARLLLLLERDPRFQESDAAAVREATRLWSKRDLRAYIDMRGLADADAKIREETARFMGRAGIEAARAPLWRLATCGYETPRVRAVAAMSLGRLRIARGDLARRLARLARDESEDVRHGAISGLEHLGVRQAALALADLINGEEGPQARRALSRMTGQPAKTDWRPWILSPACTLPHGT